MDQTESIRALRDVASLINSGTDLDTVFEALVLAACRHAGWTMASIMAIDVQQGFGHVVCRYDPTLIRQTLPDRWDLATSPAMTALKRNETVYIRDAKTSEDYPGYRREAHARDYHTVLVLPMDCNDREGRPMVLNVISREIIDTNPAKLALLDLIVHLGAIAVERQYHLDEERSAAQRLQSMLDVQGSFLQQALSGAVVAELAEAVGQLLPNPIVVVDFTTNSVVGGRAPGDINLSDHEWRMAVSGSLNADLAQAARAAVTRGEQVTDTLYLDWQTGQLRIPLRVNPLEVEGEAVGALLIFPTSSEFDGLDQMLLASARFAFSVQLMRSFERFRFENRTLSELFSELVEGRWRDSVDVNQRAQRLGLQLDQQTRMVVVELPGQDNDEAMAADLYHGSQRLFQRGGLHASIFVHQRNLVALVPGDERVAAKLEVILPQLMRDLSFRFGREPVLVISERCQSHSDYATAWQRSRRTIQIGKTFDRTGIISSADFGPLTMLAAAAEVADVKSFVEASVGGIAAHDKRHNTPYLETLSTYLREGCRPQPCADTMGLHVSTLRYRLARIEELFGINVERPERRFATELALHLHQLISKAS